VDHEGEEIFRRTNHCGTEGAEAGAKTKELCRRHGISDATFYNWKAKYAGMTVSEARRLKELEAENLKLKRLLADAELDKAALKDLLGRKW
jgi:putative transposase